MTEQSIIIGKIKEDKIENSQNIGMGKGIHFGIRRKDIAHRTIVAQVVFRQGKDREKGEDVRIVTVDQ